MDKIQRYESDREGEMWKNDNGDCVLFSDHQKALKEQRVKEVEFLKLLRDTDINKELTYPNALNKIKAEIATRLLDLSQRQD